MTNTPTRAFRAKPNQKEPWKDAQPRANPVGAAHESTNDELQILRKQQNYVTAAAIAGSLGLPPDELRNIQIEALWQMAVNRNAPGTKRLAQQYGVSSGTVKQILEERANQLRQAGHDKALAACYDAATGRYLSFEEWMNQLVERWDNSTFRDRRAGSGSRPPTGLAGLLTTAARWLEYFS
jgi:hypothetical protein